MSFARRLAAFGRLPISTKSAAYAVTAADIATVLLLTGTWALTLPAAATVGNGFRLSLRNIGTGTVTITPNGAETVNGLASIGCYQRDSVELICDGTAWYALFQSTFSVVALATLSAPASLLDLPLPAEFNSFDLRLEGWEPVAASTLGARFSNNNAISFYNGSGQYFWQQGFDNGGTGSSPLYSSATSGTGYGTTGIEVTAGVQGIQSGAFNLVDIAIGPRGNTRYPGIKWNGAFGNYANRGQGSLSISTADLTHLRLLYNTSNIAAGARYSLIGRRG